MSAPVLTAPEAPVHDITDERSRDRRSILLAAGVALLTAVPVIPDKLEALSVVCLVLAPFVARRISRGRLVLWLGSSLVLWLVGQLLSDEVNGLGLRLSMQVATAATILCVVPVLLVVGGGDFRRIRFLVMGVAFGLVLETLLVEHAPITAPTTWKFGLNDPVAVGLLAFADLAWRRGRRAPSVIALGTICLLGVITDHRHLAGVAVMTGMVLLVRNGKKHPRTVSVLAGLVLLIGALSGAFIQAATSGALGERSGDQIAQFGGTPQSILVNVRPEPFQEFYLFSLRPVLGWGSQPQLTSAAYQGSKDFLRHLGVVREDLDDIWLNLEVPGVSAHSQAMDSWARAGLSAVPFWLLLVGVALYAGVAAIRTRSSPLLVLWTILILWDAFFSPLTALSHVELAAYLALTVTTVLADRRSRVPDA